jgi:hypothetical protein
MEFKGTKGEWKQRQMFENTLCTTFEDGSECYHNEINIHDNNGRIIASVSYQTNTNRGWGKNETIEKWKANAQLIATAPTMLDMLNRIFIEKCNGVNNIDYSEIENVINQATKID